MRVALLWTLTSVALAQEATKPAHDQLGFPITFNTERITRSDVLRSMGSPGDPDDGSVASARDKLLMDKVTERIAEIWGIEVLAADVQREIRREIDQLGGEAKFHRYLSERGDTLARYEEEKRLQLLRYNINFLLNHGISPPPDQRILPWEIRPSPAEVRTAIKADAERLKQLGPRVRGLLLRVEVDRKTRVKIITRVRKNPKLDLSDELAKEADRLAEEVLKRLEGGEAFADVAKSMGQDTEKRSKVWIPLPSEPADDPAVRFLQTGKPGTRSGALTYPGGIVKFAYLIERASPGSADRMTPELYNRYLQRIFDLRRRKVQAVMRLDALDRSSVKPRFLLKHFRSDVVADLRAAVTGLKALGLR